MEAPDAARPLRRDGLRLLFTVSWTVSRQEGSHVVGLNGELRTLLAVILLKPQDGPLTDRHITVLLALALPDQDQSTVEREIVELQPHQLEPAQPGRVEDLEQSPVPQSVNCLSTKHASRNVRHGGSRILFLPEGD